MDFLNKIGSLIEVVNKHLDFEDQLLSSNLTKDDVFSSIFESGFFKRLSQYIFHELMPFTECIPHPEVILGIMVGLSLQNVNMIRNNFLELIGNEIDNDHLKALIGIITKDLSDENCIRKLCKHINIDSNLAINLIELANDNIQSDKFNTAYAVCKKYCSAPYKVSSLVALFKRDLSMINYLSRKLKLDSDLMSVILACWCNRLDLINKNFKLISDKLEINNVYAVESILKIWSGDIEQVWKLKDKKNEQFAIQDAELLYSLMYLITNGKQITQQSHKLWNIDWSFAWQTIWGRLSKSINLLNSNNVKGLNTHRNNHDEGGNQSQSNANIHNDNHQIEINKKLLPIFKLLVKAWWKDKECVKIVADTIANYADSNGIRNEIWIDHSGKKLEIVEQSLLKVYKVAKDSVNILGDIFEERISENKEYLDILDGTTKYNREIRIKSSNDYMNRAIGKFRDTSDQAAFKVGCTININGNNPLLQTYYICKKCSTEVQKEIKVCASCVKFWHYEHKTIIAK